MSTILAKMKTPTSLLLCLIIAGVAAPTVAAAADPAMRINVQAEKTNAILNIDEGDVCDVNEDKKRNGVCAQTNDFRGKKIQVIASFADSVTEAMLAPLKLKGGSSIVGTLQCKRIRMGKLPDIPQLDAMVLADGCTLKALKNK